MTETPKQKPLDEAMREFVDGVSDPENLIVENEPDLDAPSFVKVSIGIVLNTQSAEEAMTWAQAFTGLLGVSPLHDVLIESFLESVSLVQREEEEPADG